MHPVPYAQATRTCRETYRQHIGFLVMDHERSHHSLLFFKKPTWQYLNTHIRGKVTALCVRSHMVVPNDQTIHRLELPAATPADTL